MIYLKFYKPYDVLCQFSDPIGRNTLKDYISIPDIYSVGRLDYRSEGLLLLTNDGKLSHYLTDPQYQHKKTYLAQVEGIATNNDIQALQTTLVLPQLQTQLARAKIIPDPMLPPRSKPVRDYHPTTWLEIEIGEGKKHQVRRMTAAIGFPTLRLVRVAIGTLQLEQLEPGEWRYLKKDEIASLKKPPETR